MSDIPSTAARSRTSPDVRVGSGCVWQGGQGMRIVIVALGTALVLCNLGTFSVAAHAQVVREPHSLVKEDKCKAVRVDDCEQGTKPKELGDQAGRRKFTHLASRDLMRFQYHSSALRYRFWERRQRSAVICRH